MPRTLFIVNFVHSHYLASRLLFNREENKQQNLSQYLNTANAEKYDQHPDKPRRHKEI